MQHLDTAKREALSMAIDVSTRPGLNATDCNRAKGGNCGGLGESHQVKAHLGRPTGQPTYLLAAT